MKALPLCACLAVLTTTHAAAQLPFPPAPMAKPSANTFPFTAEVEACRMKPPVYAVAGLTDTLAAR